MFIEGYARDGKLDQANALTQNVVAKNGLLKPNLCALWKRLYVDAAQDQGLQNATAKTESTLQCVK